MASDVTVNDRTDTFLELKRLLAKTRGGEERGREREREETVRSKKGVINEVGFLLVAPFTAFPRGVPLAGEKY